MCDLYSWGVVKFDMPEKNLKAGDVLFLIDAEAATLKDLLKDCIGHEAIAEYYGISEAAFQHKEGLENIPEKLYKEISKGHLAYLAAASDKPYAARLTWSRNADGTYSVSADDPYRTMSTIGHMAAFEFCRLWLREHYPKEATKIMDLLEKRRVTRSNRICAPLEIVDRLLRWRDYPSQDILCELNEALSSHVELRNV